MGDFDINIDKVSANPKAEQVRRAAPAKTSNGAAEVRTKRADAADAVAADAQAVQQVKQLVQPGDTEEQTLERVAEYLESFIPDLGLDNSLKIDKDEEAGRFVYKSVDNKSGETVKQYPAEEFLDFLKAFRETSGILIDNKV